MACCKPLRSCCASEPFIFLYFVTVGMHLSIVPQLLLKKLCLATFNATVCSGNSDAHAQENIVHQQAAHWNMITFLVVTGPSIFAVLIFGTISDLFLKKYFLIAPPIAMGLQSIVYILSSQYMELHVGLLVVGASLTCFYGDIQGAIMLGYSYVADITDMSHHRTIRMAFLESSLCCGQALGSWIGGILLHKFGFVFVFSTSLSIGLINLCYVTIMLPANPSENYENIDKDGDDGVDVGTKLTCGKVVFMVILRIKTVMKYFSCQKKGIILTSLVATVVLVTSAIMGENFIIVLFVKHTPLSLNASQVGQFLLLLHASRGIGMLIISIIGIKFFIPQDYILALLGTAALVITHVVISFAKDLKILFAITPVSIFIPLALSSLRAAITKQVSPTHHGTALALTSCVNLFGVEITAAASNVIYKMTESTYPGAAVLLLASMSAVACIIIGILCFYSNCIDNERSGEEDEATNYHIPMLLNGTEERHVESISD